MTFVDPCPVCASSLSTEAHRTANIRPMATPVSVQARHLQSAPVPPVRSSTPAESRAMASIRPMAVAPMATLVTMAAQTPTATVMPTTVSVQDSEMVAPIINIPQSGPTQRPTQQVQPVSPHVGETTTVQGE